MIKPESRTMARSFGAGVAGIIVLSVLLWLTFEAQYGMPFAPKTYVKVAFDNTDSLLVKDPVRQNSKGIGRVTGIEYADGRAVVTLQIEQGGDYEVYKNATASIQDQSAVGAKFVALDPGTPDAGRLGEDEILPTSQTTDSKDLYQVLNVFDEDTRAGAQGLLQQVGGGMAGQAENFRDFTATAPDLLTDLGSVSQALSSEDADLPAMLQAAESLAGRFEGREDEIASLIEQTESTFSAISVDETEPLRGTLDRAPDTLTELQTALDSLNAPLSDTAVAMRDLEAGAEALGTSEEDLRGVLREGVPVLEKVPGVADQAEPSVEDLTETFADARPLAPRVTEAMDMAVTPLQELAPYAYEAGTLFVRGRSFVSEGGAPGKHYARLNANVIGPWSFTGGILEACDFATNPYPEPGEADHDRTELGVNHVTPCGVNPQLAPNVTPNAVSSGGN